MDLGPSFEDISRSRLIFEDYDPIKDWDPIKARQDVGGGERYTATGRYSAASRARGDHKPTADELFAFLLEGMAGANYECAVVQGPPRRPATVLVSYRLRHAFDVLSELLEQVDVHCVLEPEEQSRSACAQHHTDMETGCPANTEDEKVVLEKRGEEAFIGTTVMLRDLSKQELNGLVGVVIDWHSDRQRWEVRLKGQRGTVAVKSDKLAPAEIYIPDEDDEELSDIDLDLDEEERKEVELEIQKLRHVHPDAAEGEVCAICIESLAPLHGDKKPTKLPCGHFFHFSCVLPWLQKHGHCPCCRETIYHLGRIEADSI